MYSYRVKKLHSFFLSDLGIVLYINRLFVINEKDNFSFN